MELSTKESRNLLYEALLGAFPSQRDLALFIGDSLGIDAKQIARSTSYHQFVTNLIQFTEAQGRLTELIEAVAQSNLQNPALKALLDRFTGSKLTIRRIPRTGQGYIEPLLDVGQAIPLHMVFISGGTFTMGSPEDELERNDDRESPQHDVTVPPFFMGRYPVTQAQWRAVAAMSEMERKLDPEPSQFKGKDNHPVEQISWDDAVEFCARLAKHTSRPYRLPCEAEWEYACRAATTTPFYFGKTLTDGLANYRASEIYAGGPKGKDRQQTTPIDHFGIANAFGLADMHGNVFEWCQDHWHDNYEGAPIDGSAWLTDDEKAFRVYRGGAWAYDPRYCRSAYRDYPFDPTERNSYIGFRIVAKAPELYSPPVLSPAMLLSVL